MIKTLKKKFVVTAMIAISVLLISLLGALNLFNYFSVQKEISRTLMMLSENEVLVDSNENEMLRDNQPPFEFYMKNPRNKHDVFMTSTFFCVRFGKDGEVLRTDVSRVSSLKENDAEKMAQAAYEKGSSEGQDGKFRYTVKKDIWTEETVIVFLDTSTEMYSFFRVFLLSCMIGLVFWGMMLVLVILLSNRAIKPIAENIERQQQFVTNAGHEIKTPLAIIQSNTEAMELYIGENKWSKNIKEQTQRLSGLMKNLLLLARMDEGAAEVNISEFQFSVLLEKMIQEFEQPIEARNIRLQKEIQPELFLQADQSQIEHLISILMDNAVKYANENGEIFVSLRKEQKKIILQIQNSCESLPDVLPERLFERFYRADKARTQKNGGYGIGLSMARSIVAVNKGTINAEYIQPNTICFSVRF